MLELRHNPWCEGLDCVDSIEEPLEGVPEGELDPEGGSLQEGAGVVEDTISSSLQLVLPSDFAPSRMNSKICSTILHLHISSYKWGLTALCRVGGGRGVHT